MPRFVPLTERLLQCLPEVSGGSVPAENVDAFARELAEAVERRFGAAVLPETRQSVAVTLDSPKTAALFFDRIWWPPAMLPSLPNDIVVFGATDEEVWSLVSILLMKPPRGLSWQQVRSALEQDTPVSKIWSRSAPAAVMIADALWAKHKLKTAPLYDSIENCQNEYLPGDARALVAAIEGVRVISEATLSWKQVVQVRSDKRAMLKLRRMRNWLDGEFAGKPITYVSDQIALRLDDYEWALKKHGVETVVGTLGSLLDPKFLSAASATVAGIAFAGGEFWAALGASAVFTSKAALSVTSHLLDLQDKRRGKNSEIAYIHEVAAYTAED